MNRSCWSESSRQWRRRRIQRSFSSCPLHVQLRGICAAISAAPRGVLSGCDTEAKTIQPPDNPIKFAYSPHDYSPPFHHHFFHSWKKGSEKVCYFFFFSSPLLSLHMFWPVCWGGVWIWSRSKFSMSQREIHLYKAEWCGERKKRERKKLRDVVFVVSVGCMQNEEGRSAGIGAASCRQERGEMSRCLSLICPCHTEHIDWQCVN